MARTGTKPNRTKRRKSPLPYLLPLGVVLLAAVLLAAAVLGELRRRGGSDRPEEEGRYVEVNDGVNRIWITPAEGVAVSDLTEADFRTEDGVVRYVGTAHRARQGVDVSEHQEEIDWAAAAADGVEFAVIRIGFRGSTEGGVYPDARFEDNCRGAREAGVDAGVYFFSQAVDPEEAAAEADFVLETLGGRTLELPVFFDWEPAEDAGARTGDMDGETLTACAGAFCRRIEAGGYRAGIYFNRQQGYREYDLGALKDWAFWVSDPNERTDFYYAVSMWQYSFDGRVDGIPGRVDRDILFD